MPVIKKEGGAFDLAIALSILASIKIIPPEALASIAAIGELGLDGRVKGVAGVLPMALAAHRHKRRLMLPAENLHEAALVKGLVLIPVTCLQEAFEALSGQRLFTPFYPASQESALNETDFDFSDIKGQPHAKRAIEIAVAGGHHILLIGPPGSGKTMLAQRIPTLLPPLTNEESMEVTAIHSIAGLLKEVALIRKRPFRAPHHTTSAASLVGGGPYPKPGELSLAHQGVLFLDELPEFHRDGIESLRQPLEEGVVRISRVKRSLSFPAKCLLVAAMNPCPCGFLMDSKGRCRCSSHQIQSYLSKLSGPLLDRIDLHVEVPALSFENLSSNNPGETSHEMRRRIDKALRLQRKRSKAPNAQLRHREIKRFCALNSACRDLLKTAMQNLGFSARSYDKILKIARTIADMAGTPDILPEHIAEAIGYRSLDRQWWG